MCRLVKEFVLPRRFSDLKKSGLPKKINKADEDPCSCRMTWLMGMQGIGCHHPNLCHVFVTPGTLSSTISFITSSHSISSHGLRSRSFETNAWTFRLCAITWRCWNVQIRDDAANDFLLIHEMEDYGICKDCLRQRDQGTLPLVLMLSILSRQDCALFLD